MVAATEGIVLRFVKFGESSVIATLYTRDFGRQGYVIRAARSKKSKSRAGILQPLFLVDLTAYHKPNRELHNVNEIKINRAYQNIPFDIIKSTQAIFLAEILYKTIGEQERFQEMYDFIKNSLLYFDLMDEGSSNFHLFFLLRLTEYLGFLPGMEKTGFEGWFDMKKGSVSPFQPSHPFYANKEITEYLIKLADLKIQELGSFHPSKTIRESLTTVLVDYFQLHFENLGGLKSLPVLKEVFR